jgi:aldose 1-epimerase
MTNPSPPIHELRAGALRLALRPDLGGAIAGLWHHHVPVLRSVEPAELSGPRAGGSFPLVPYSNRIGHRRFRWKGHDYTTAPNFDASPHSLHGVGWRRPWTVESSSALEVVLALAHQPDADWPFAFEARQFITLAPSALHLAMTCTNTGTAPQPVGLGWHPYFPKRARSRLHVECSARWDKDAQDLPVRAVPLPGLDGDVAHMDFDHCFDGWRGAARIRDERFALTLTSSLDRLVVYTPPTRDYFCVEPVSHVNNAIHMAEPLAHGLRSVAPGETFEAWMQLDIAVV